MNFRRKQLALLLLFCLLTGGIAAPFVHSFQHGHDQVHTHAEADSHHDGEGNLLAESFKAVDCSLYAVPLCALDPAPDEAPRLLPERELQQAPIAPLTDRLLTLHHIRGPPHLG